jgi:hypothetical protein
LFRCYAHPSAHPGIRLVDIGSAGVDAEFLGFLDLQLFIDQFIEHLLPIGGFVGRQQGQLAALLDIEVGDRVAIDHDGDRLRIRNRGRDHQDESYGATQYEI